MIKTLFYAEIKQFSGTQDPGEGKISESGTGNWLVQTITRGRVQQGDVKE